MIVLGPCPCQGCRSPVVYMDKSDSFLPGLRWRDVTGWPHICMAPDVRVRDNEPVGISDASPDRMSNALMVADTSREGVPRLEVSAP